jgi:hypothetical protein
MRIERGRKGGRPAHAVALIAFALGLAHFAALPATSHAHGRSISYSSWELDEGGANVSVRVSRLDLSRLPLTAAEAARPGPPGPASNTAHYLARRLALAAGGEPCSAASPPTPRPAAEGWVAFGWRLDCQASGGRVIESRILLDAAPSHLHFARVSASGAGRARVSAVDKGTTLERVLTEADPVWFLGSWGGEAGGAGNAPEPAGSSFLRYLALGIEHILTGYDHLAFVFALLLLAGSLRQVAGLVTGFTIAHSITLALAVLGLLRPEAAAVEAVIGFSVALVAAENGWLLSGRDRRIAGFSLAGLLLLCALAAAGYGVLSLATLLGLTLFSLCHFELLARTARPTRVRTFLAFAFGLVHGFGFAGVLAEMSLPASRLAPALFGFNLGVEVGQLAVVALAWPLLRLLNRIGEGSGYRWTSQVASAGICGLGLYWFIVRAFGEG